MKASDYLINFLRQRGVTNIFEVVGGMITHLIDSGDRQPGMQLVSMHHEQAAAFAADAVGRMTGLPGVAMATSGPGAVNLLTGIGSCFFDSVPAIFVTGQVNLNEQRGVRPIRQLGFQETDIVSMAQPITKAAWSIRTVEEIPLRLNEAFRIALAGRRGPVLLDIPMDLQRANLSEEPRPPTGEETPSFNDSAIVEALLTGLSQAERPLILVGGGVHAARAVSVFRHFVEQAQVPVVNSLLAVDALPYFHPLRVGLIGTYGNRWANMALGTCDLLIVLGSRLDIRQTGADVKTFQMGRTIFHVDCDPGEINNRVQGCRPVVADLSAFLLAATHAAEAIPVARPPDWLAQISQWRRTWPDAQEPSTQQGINPNNFMHALSQASQAAAAYVVDVGNHQMWAAQSLELGAGQRLLTSGGMGSMGFSLPAAIGAAFAAPRQPILQICGDGGMQMNLQELQTVFHHQLPLKMVVLNNHSYGMVRQFQQTYFHERYPATYWGYSAPDFAKVARAFGIASATITEPAEIRAGLAELWAQPQSPFLLQVHIDPLANVYPKIAFGYPLTEMEPFAKPLDMEGT